MAPNPDGREQGSPAIRAALRGYDPSGEQWEAIKAPLEPQAIVAGAGSGKTAVMAARIVWLVEQEAVRPSGVLGLTFTNKAALELEERLALALGQVDPHPREHPTVMTYHAFAAQIVREHGPRLGIAGEAALLSEAQKWQILLSLVDSLPSFDELELRHPLSFIPQTLELANQCSNHLVSPEELAAECERLLPELTDERSRSATRKRKDFSHILRKYIDAKRQAGRIDFGDQITLAVDLLQQFDDVAAGLRQRFPVVLLDEYQDTNPAQRKLMQLLCPPGSAVTAVGDARQAIYAWRGATMFNLIRFPVDFPRADGTTCTPASLRANYRSGRKIVALANSIIEQVPPERRPGEQLVAVAPNGEGDVAYGLLADQEAEAAFIADTIERLHENGPDGSALQWRDFAILVRKRRYMDHIVGLLERRDIPVETPELGGLLKVPPVVDAVAWLRVLSDPGPSTNRWVARILLGPRFRIHYRDLAPIARWAAERNSALSREASETLAVDEPDPGEVAFSLLEALTHADEIDGVSHEARERIGTFLALRTELLAQASAPLMELAQLVIDRTGLADTLVASPARSAPAMGRNLQTFVGVCAAFSPIEGEPTLDTFLDYLDAAEESEDTITVASTAPSDSVKVMTVHAAKGLEFDVVFLPVMAAEQEPNRDGWRKGSVFPDVRASDPFNSAQALPNTIRDDAEYLPRLEQYNTKAAYNKALKERALEDERRLLYVAVTRARRHLYCTAAHWYGTEPRKGPSIFLEEIVGHPETTSLRVDEPGDTNPLLATMSSELRWPPDPPCMDDDTMRWIETVEGLVARTLNADDILTAGSVDLLEGHLTTIEMLTAPRQTVPSPDPEPRSLAATVAARMAAGKPEHPAGSVLMERPTQARRLGVEVHAWIEERARGLVGLAEEDALEEPSLTPDPATVERMRRSYVDMGYESRPLARLDSGEPMAELPFTLKVAGLLVRGRIDAVYEQDDTLEIVDFKTGHQTEEPAREQLELYAEALAALGYATGEVTLTYAYLATGVARSWTYTPQGVEPFEARLREALSRS